MRVLMATDAFPPGCGGSGWSTYELARGLRDRGHEMTIVMPRVGTTTAGPERDAFDGFRPVTVPAFAPRPAARRVADAGRRAAKTEQRVAADVRLEVHRQIEASRTPPPPAATQVERTVRRRTACQPRRVHALHRADPRNRPSKLGVPLTDDEMQRGARSARPEALIAGIAMSRSPIRSSRSTRRRRGARVGCGTLQLLAAVAARRSRSIEPTAHRSRVSRISRCGNTDSLASVDFVPVDHHAEIAVIRCAETARRVPRGGLETEPRRVPRSGHLGREVWRDRQSIRLNPVGDAHIAQRAVIEMHRDGDAAGVRGTAAGTEVEHELGVLTRRTDNGDVRFVHRARVVDGRRVDFQHREGADRPPGEMATVGHTSEDVADGLRSGMFGMAAETAEAYWAAVALADREGYGLGQAVGRQLAEAAPEFGRLSVLGAAYEHDVPATLHVTFGADTVHMAPQQDAAALGRAAVRDFGVFAEAVTRLHDGGVYLNLGSAVTLPEVFLKAVNIARNVTGRPHRLVTANLDMVQHYRPAQNVVDRPTQPDGHGYSITGHHEILFPLLYAMVRDRLS